MNVDIATRDLQRCLLEQSLIEAAAAVFARRLSRSAFLTAEERDFAADRLCPDEAAHMRWCRAAARYLGRCDRLAVADRLVGELELHKARLRDDASGLEGLRCLVRLHFDERFFLRFSNRYLDVMSRMLPDDIARGATHLLRDERCHKEWGSRVRRRLRSDYPELMRDMRRYETVRDYPIHALAQRVGKVYRALSVL